MPYHCLAAYRPVVITLPFYTFPTTITYSLPFLPATCRSWRSALCSRLPTYLPGLAFCQFCLPPPFVMACCLCHVPTVIQHNSGHYIMTTTCLPYHLRRFSDSTYCITRFNAFLQETNPTFYLQQLCALRLYVACLGCVGFLPFCVWFFCSPSHYLQTSSCIVGSDNAYLPHLVRVVTVVLYRTLLITVAEGGRPAVPSSAVPACWFCGYAHSFWRNIAANRFPCCDVADW